METRRKTGRGQYLDMAMYECLASHIESNMNSYHATGKAPGRSWDRLATAGITFEAKDGYLVLAGARTEERLRSLWKTVGREDLAEDPRYLKQMASAEFYMNNIIPAIEDWSLERPKAEVAMALIEIGFSIGIAQNMDELANCSHLGARDMFVDTGNTLGGTFRSLRTPVRLTGCQDSPKNTPPKLGEHNRELLCTLGGLSPETLGELEAQGAA